MTYGAQVLGPDGSTVVFDSRVAQVGVIAALVQLAPYEVWERTYPGFAGRGMFVLQANNYAAESAATVDYALGYPRVRIQAPPASQYLTCLVFAA